MGDSVVPGLSGLPNLPDEAGGGGGKGGGKGGGDDYGGSNEQAGYSAFDPNSPMPADPSHPEYEFFKAGWERAQAEYEYQKMIEEMMSGFEDDDDDDDDEEDIDPLTEETTSFGTLKEELGEIEAGSMYAFTDDKWQIIGLEDMPEDLAYGYSYLGNDYATGIEGRGTDYESYLDNFSAATTYINEQISTEEKNAALIGVDYDITDEDRSRRINEYFGTMWSETDQQGLQDIFEEWGNPEGFTDWLHDPDLWTWETEGGGDTEDDSGPAQERQRKGGSSSSLLTDEDETLGSGKKSKSLLGD